MLEKAEIPPLMQVMFFSLSFLTLPTYHFQLEWGSAIEKHHC